MKHTPFQAFLLGALSLFFLSIPAPAAPGLFPDGDEEEERWFAVVGGDVHTGLGDVLRGATVLSRDGVIQEIGFDVRIPEGAEVLEARGYRVYPGLVALDATSRLSAGGFMSAGPPVDHAHPVFGEEAQGAVDPERGAEDGHSAEEPAAGPTEAEEPVRTALEDSFDPFSGYLILALATGITTAEQSSAAVKLKRGEIEGLEMRSKYLASLSYSTRSPSKMEELRNDFRAARRYLRELREYEAKKKEDEDLEEPSKKGIKSSLLDILEGRNRGLFRATARTDLLNIARLAQEFGFRPVIDGCGEGWVVAGELGRSGAAAIVTPRYRRDKPENLVRQGGSSIENAALLHQHGVQIAISPSSGSIDLGGITGRDLMHLPIEAAFAVRGGLSEEAALAGITIVPARLLGVDDRVGSIEVGKDCDLIVTDGDVLHYQTYVQWTVVEGKVVYDKEEELFFAHIRPRPKSEEADSETGDGDAEPEEAGPEPEPEEDGGR